MPKKPKSQGAPLVTIQAWSSAKSSTTMTSSTSASSSVVSSATVSINR